MSISAVAEASEGSDVGFRHELSLVAALAKEVAKATAQVLCILAAVLAAMAAFASSPKTYIIVVPLALIGATALFNYYAKKYFS